MVSMVPQKVEEEGAELQEAVEQEETVTGGSQAGQRALHRSFSPKMFLF